MNANRTLSHLALVTAGIASASAVVAEPNPYYLGASQGFTHESNLFRAPKGSETSDTISTTSLLAGFNQPVSRQRFFGDAAVRYNRYNTNDQLNNTGYGLNAGWDWATVNNLSGTLSYSVNESLASFSDFSGATVTTTANRERNQQFLARGQLGAQSRLSLETTYIYRKREYSAAAFVGNEFDQNTLSLGALYRPSGLLTLGAAVRGSRGRYPFAVGAAPGPFTADKFDRNDFDLTAVWTPSGFSKVAARLSYSHEDHDLIVARNFSGVTGALTWEYKPTGKLTFTTEFVRDTGAEAAFNGYVFTGANPTGNNNEVSTALRLRALYEVTAKINLEVDGRYVKSDLLPSGSDKTGYASIGANYAPARNWRLGCSFAYEKRGGGSPVPYTADVAACSAQFILQ
ncbi:hypothetical protein [Methylibium sp.]|uniref:hypothetical protein n=1 Tax=Methylibium sp. TaxID=2067992 RepID=UPI003D14778F